MEKRRHKYNQERKEAYKQKPFIKPPRISFWDNIFYWSWYSTKHGLPHRTFATVTVIQYVYVVLFTAVILNCLDSQTAWHLYILHKSKGILGYILVPFVILKRCIMSCTAATAQQQYGTQINDNLVHDAGCFHLIICFC